MKWVYTLSDSYFYHLTQLAHEYASSTYQKHLNQFSPIFLLLGVISYLLDQRGGSD